MKSNIIYEDDQVMVIHKPAGLATQTSKLGEADLVSEIKNYLKQSQMTKGEPYLGLVHRLDQPVEGLLVLGKTDMATAFLSKELTTNQMNKSYYAVVSGTPKETDTLEDYLFKNPKTNLSEVVSKDRKDAKLAKLSYETLETNEDGSCSLVRVTLFTGRHHQIRVQMSNAGLPLLGDVKYGSEASNLLSKEKGIRQVLLAAYELSFTHPATKKKMEYQIIPSAPAYKVFRYFSSEC